MSCLCISSIVSNISIFSGESSGIISGVSAPKGNSVIGVLGSLILGSIKKLGKFTVSIGSLGSPVLGSTNKLGKLTAPTGSIGSPVLGSNNKLGKFALGDSVISTEGKALALFIKFIMSSAFAIFNLSLR